MINFDDVTQENIKEHNPSWQEIAEVGGSGTGNTNPLLNLINNESDIDKIYLHAKDPYEAKYQFLIK